MNKIKGLLKSKTFWFNVVTGGLSVVNALQKEQIIPTETAATIITVGNVILRMITTKPIEKK